MFLAVGQVPTFARIAERHPRLTLIIDHMGLNLSSRPNRITENVPAAIDQAVTLAKYPTNSFAKASYRQRVAHVTEELSFLSESDKDWVMGRAILARLKWA